MKRERDFYRSRGQACPKDVGPNNISVIEADATVPVKEEAKPTESDCHRLDEQVIYLSINNCDVMTHSLVNYLTHLQVNVCLETCGGSMKALKRRFIRCSALATITNLKKYIAKKTLNSIDKYKDVS